MVTWMYCVYRPTKEADRNHYICNTIKAKTKQLAESAIFNRYRRLGWDKTILAHMICLFFLTEQEAIHTLPFHDSTLDSISTRMDAISKNLIHSEFELDWSPLDKIKWKRQCQRTCLRLEKITIPSIQRYLHLFIEYHRLDIYNFLLSSLEQADHSVMESDSTWNRFREWFHSVIETDYECSKEREFLALFIGLF